MPRAGGINASATIHAIPVQCFCSADGRIRRLTPDGNAVAVHYFSGFQTGVRGPKGVRDGFPRGPREDAEK